MLLPFLFLREFVSVYIFHDKHVFTIDLLLSNEAHLWNGPHLNFCILKSVHMVDYNMLITT
jgi:hypothetical protein